MTDRNSHIPRPHPSAIACAITEEFYGWDVRGRGWSIAPVPVDIEPIFERAFQRRTMFPLGHDDGRRASVLSQLFQRIASAVAPKRTADGQNPKTESLAFITNDERTDLAHLRVSTPRESVIGKELSERLILGIGNAQYPISFETVSNGGRVRQILTASANDITRIEQTIRVLAPDISTVRDADVLSAAWNANAGIRCVLELGLSNEFILPLECPRRYEPDPLAACYGALADLGNDECCVIQTIFKPVRHPWASEMLSAALGPSGDGLFSDAPEIVQQCKHKISSPLYAAVVRIASSATEDARARDIARNVVRGFGVFKSSVGNELIPLSNDEYPIDVHDNDLVARISHRTGMILNTEELACFAHIPDRSLYVENLDRETRHSQAVPERLRDKQGVCIGVNRHRGREHPIYLSTPERLRHIHVMGATGAGKSTLLEHLILQDLEAGHGVAIFDPHADLVDRIARLIPSGRHADVTILDPSDARGLVPVNLLAAKDDTERTVIASDLVAIFRRFSTSWGDQMTAVLGNAFNVFLEIGGTLLEVRRYLIDSDFRERVLGRIADEETSLFWRKAYPHIGQRSIGPILARLDAFLRPKPIREIVSGAGPGLDFSSVLDGGVLLVRLAHGAIGEENAFLLGSLLSAKLHQAALARQSRDAQARRPFFFYADEAHQIATPSMTSLLSSGRKFGLGLALAHQGLEQLRAIPDFESALIANAHTRVAFRLGDRDARNLAASFKGFTPDDLTSLRLGEAIVRTGDTDVAFNLAVPPPVKIDVSDLGLLKERLLSASAAKFDLPSAVEHGRAALEHGGTAFAEEPSNPATGETGRSSRSPAPQTGERPAGSGPEAGRGGSEHKYIQHLIARLGEDRGFRAVIEETVLDGRIDVALYRDTVKLAFEVSITTPPEYEAQNIGKCLAAEYANVFVVSGDAKHRRAIEKHAQVSLASADLKRVRFLAPEDIVSALDEYAPVTETTVRGYRVKVSRRTLSPEELKERQDRVAKVIAKSLRDKKK